MADGVRERCKAPGIRRRAKSGIRDSEVEIKEKEKLRSKFTTYYRIRYSEADSPFDRDISHTNGDLC
jgi:hypothetical protein